MANHQTCSSISDKVYKSHQRWQITKHVRQKKANHQTCSSKKTWDINSGGEKVYAWAGLEWAFCDMPIVIVKWYLARPRKQSRSRNPDFFFSLWQNKFSHFHTNSGPHFTTSQNKIIINYIETQFLFMQNKKGVVFIQPIETGTWHWVETHTNSKQIYCINIMKFFHLLIFSHKYVARPTKQWKPRICLGPWLYLPVTIASHPRLHN